MAIITVGSSGADYTTINAAATAATSTDTIRLITDITEALIMDGTKNFARVESDSTRRTWTGVSGNIITTFDGLTNLDIDNIEFHTDTGANPTTGQVYIQYSSTIVRVNITNCIFVALSSYASGANSLLTNSLAEALPGEPFLIINQCEFIGTNSSTGQNIGIRQFDLWNGAYSALIKNCIFRNWSGPADVNKGAISGFYVADPWTTNVYNCTFYNNDVAIYSDETSNITNCLFIGNTDDVNFGSSGRFTKSDFLNCAFGEQTDDGGWDASNIFGVITNDEVTNAAGGNFSLKAGAQSIDAGATLSDVLVDFIGTSRPQGSAYDIGAYEFIATPNGNVIIVRTAPDYTINPDFHQDDLNQAKEIDKNGRLDAVRDVPPKNGILTPSPKTSPGYLNAEKVIEDIENRYKF